MVVMILLRAILEESLPCFLSLVNNGVKDFLYIHILNECCYPLNSFTKPVVDKSTNDFVTIVLDVSCRRLMKAFKEAYRVVISEIFKTGNVK